jgi:iron complex outermembrane recepter protein
VLLGAHSGAHAADAPDDVVTLEEFIARETSLQSADTLSQTARPFDALFGIGKTALDVPRSVVALNPEAMKQYGLRDFSDLPRVSAGAQRVNYFGVPGAPQFRGDLASVYFNGMERTYQRNEMPTSFGSLEAMDLVRGPAPAHFGPSQAGGFVNMIPKSPYFDQFRGSTRATLGSHRYVNVQFDVGGPREIFGRPAAWRLSVTGQNAGSYWRNVRNDFLSLYGAAKMQLSRDTTLFTGVELYRFWSNENAGWNRVTQDLIDHGRYLAGEVPDLVTHSSNRSDAGLSKGVTPFVSVPAVTGREPTVFSPLSGNAAAIIPPASFVSTLSPELRALLGPQGQYTAAYLNAGGPVCTVPIDGSTVLADPDDHANSQSLLWFCDVVHELGDGRRVKNQLLVDALRTAKLSSYGYAFDNDQVVFNEKLSLEQTLPLGRRTHAALGGGLKYTFAKQLQDFDDEPFSRRDITNPVITTNSIVLSGAEVDDTGLNHWSRYNGSVESQLGQLGLFAVLDTTWTERFSTLVSVRAEAADFRIRRPDEVDRRTDRGQVIADGAKNTWNASVSPVLSLGAGLRAYASAQVGATFVPTQGGVIDRGEGNFADSELYEIGLKGEFLERRLFASVAGYRWDKTRYDLRSGILNPLSGRGIELEASYVHESGFALLANATFSRTCLGGLPGLRFQATQDYYMPLVAGGLFSGGGGGNTLVLANNPDRVVPGTPEIVVNALAAYRFASGFGVAFGPTWRSSYWHNFDRTLHLPATTIVNANFWYRRDRFEVFLELTNLFNEDWFLGSDPFFAANTVITKAPPLEVKLSFTRRF